MMQAESETAVARTLDERDLFPVAVTIQGDANSDRSGGKVKMRDVGVFYGQLGDLLRAGVPMLRSLDTLGRAVVNRNLGEKIVELRDEVSAGRTLADSMADNPQAFSHLHAAMVRAGERAGFLEDVLTNLAEFIERQDDLRGKILGAMIYPIVLCCFGVVVMLAVLLLLVPEFKPFFVNLSLPLPTRILFSMSDLMVEHQWLFAAIVTVIVLAARAMLKSDAGKRTWDLWQLKIPGIGMVIRTVSITRFCRILGTMLANGVPILQALDISKDAAGSTILSDSIAVAAENVRAGQPLAEPLKASGLFPLEIVEMIAVAEESNQLERVLVQIADNIERRTNRQVDAAVRLIEPLILMAIAMVIGFVAVALMYPIFMISQTMA